MSLRSQSSRHVLYVNPDALKMCAEADAVWAETPEEVKAGLKSARQRALLLRWLRRQMARRLTDCERHCVELLFFSGLNYRETAEATHTNVSSVCRAVQRSIHKLRAAAAEDGLLSDTLRQRARLLNSAMGNLTKDRPSTR